MSKEYEHLVLKDAPRYPHGTRRQGYTPEDKNHPNFNVRRGAWNYFGWTEEAKKDRAPSIRRAACKLLGFSESDKEDEDPFIRHKARLFLGFTKQDLEHPTDLLIRRDAETYFSIDVEDAPLYINSRDRVEKARAEHVLKGIIK
jgi:hypothetical protein